MSDPFLSTIFGTVGRLISQSVDFVAGTTGLSRLGTLVGGGSASDSGSGGAFDQSPSGRDVLDSARMSSYPYELSGQDNIGDWRLVKSPVGGGGFATDAATGRVTSAGKDDGMQAAVFVNDKTREVRVAFGGTSSAAEGGGIGSLGRFIASLLPTQMVQWFANFQNALDPAHTPASYKQAAELVKEVKNDPRFADCSLSTTGHSLGGGEATYAAEMNYSSDRPVRAIGFNSAPLGPSAQADIRGKLSPSDQARADELVDTYSTAGDPVSRGVGLLLPTNKQPGRVHSLPQSGRSDLPLIGPLTRIPVFGPLLLMLPGVNQLSSHVDFLRSVEDQFGTGG